MMRLRDLSIWVGDRCLLSGANAEFPKGITVIVGGSGAGKSVLLRCISDLVDPDGPIAMDGHIEKSADDQVGVVFQDFALLDELSPIANVQIALDHRRERPSESSQEVSAELPNDASRRDAAMWLKELRVPDNVPTSKLSGGQKQRLAIARTLAAGTPIVLYDEPTSGLDHAAGSQVAKLISQTQGQHGGVAIVVTHDYTTLVPIADQVLLFDPESRSLTRLPEGDVDAVIARLQPTRLSTPAPAASSMTAKLGRGIGGLFSATGASAAMFLDWPRRTFPWLPHSKWSMRFTAHSLRLVAGTSAWIYMILAGAILGFVTNYFTFEFLPFRVYTQPLLLDDLLASVGFASFRILAPILATILIAARTGAAIASEMGMKRYGGQLDALRTIGVSADRLHAVSIQFSMLVTTPLLVMTLYLSATFVGWLTFDHRHPDIPAHYWSFHYGQAVVEWGGWGWVFLKSIVSAVGITAIAYAQGCREKTSAADISHSITRTILYSTLFVLVVHFVVALLEF